MDFKFLDTSVVLFVNLSLNDFRTIMRFAKYYMIERNLV